MRHAGRVPFVQRDDRLGHKGPRMIGVVQPNDRERLIHDGGIRVGRHPQTFGGHRDASLSSLFVEHGL